MELYLAESGSMFKVVHQHGRTFNGVNILQFYWYCNRFTEEVIIPHARSFMLDSGAFTARMGRAGEIDWNEYLKEYADFINRNRVDLFFELDIDTIVGYENVLKLRARLEALTGKKCIPVWHGNRGKDDFLKTCDEYPYVALGGIVGSNKLKKEYVQAMPWLVSQAHKRGAKIHGLGFTGLEHLKRIQFDSVDSSSWSSSVRFGTMHFFNGAGIVNKNQPGRVKDYKAAACHNFDEWVKYQKYARKHL